MKHKALCHHRFYFPPEARGDDVVHFSQDETAHMLKSLRLRNGDVVSATDGTGKIYDLALEHLRREKAVARIIRVSGVKPELPSIDVFQAIVKPSRMELAIEKCTELGIRGFVAVETERSARVASSARLDRWRLKAIEAMKQSLGSHLPRISPPVRFADALAGLAEYDLVLLASKGGSGQWLKDLVGGVSPTAIAVWVGPEGGFTEDEEQALIKHGALPFTLGPQRLRTETASITSVAILCELLRDRPRQSD